MPFTPSPIAVFCTVNNATTKGKDYTFRVATLRDEAEIAGAIAADRAAMAEGGVAGLIRNEAPGGKRVYRAFRATWTELELPHG